MSTAIGYKLAGGGVVYHPAGNGIMRQLVQVFDTSDTRQ